MKIFHQIIFSISIFVMNSKYFGKLFIFTNVAFFKHVSSDHLFSNCRKFWHEKFFLTFIHAFFGTIFSVRRFAIHKFLFTMKAFIFSKTSSNLRSMITKPGAIFCFIASRRNMFKIVSTNQTICFYKHAIRFIFTVFRTIFKSINSVFRHVQSFFTTQTNNIMRFQYATP